MIIRSTIARILERIRLDHEDGQGLAEYALILALIAVISIVALIFMGSQIIDTVEPLRWERNRPVRSPDGPFE